MSPGRDGMAHGPTLFRREGEQADQPFGAVRRSAARRQPDLDVEIAARAQREFTRQDHHRPAVESALHGEIVRTTRCRPGRADEHADAADSKSTTARVGPRQSCIFMHFPSEATNRGHFQ